MSKYWTYQINPVSGCTPASEACANCYARELHERFRMAEKPVQFYSKPFDQVTLQPEQLKKFDELARMQKPQVVFVGNMCDLFHKDVPDDYIKDVMSKISGMWRSPHTFLILTKRAQRMHDFFEFYPFLPSQEGRQYAMERYMPNVWLGVTAENQARADERIPYLLDTPAAHKWVSVEPMLGPVDVLKYNGTVADLNRCCCEGPKKECNACPYDGPGFDLVIAGGESGRQARPSKREWFINLHHQCIASCTLFYLKQWGDAYEDKSSVMRDSARFFEPEAFEQPFIKAVKP